VNRAEKREQLTKKTGCKEAKQNREDEIQDNPLLSERQKNTRREKRPQEIQLLQVEN
jgi:hypothetical protein